MSTENGSCENYNNSVNVESKDFYSSLPRGRALSKPSFSSDLQSKPVHPRIRSASSNGDVISRSISGAASPRGQFQEAAAKRLARRLYELDGFDQLDVVRQLARKSAFHDRVAMEYVSYFDFSNQNLIEALRIFLAKFLLSGESQEQERILLFFSQRYIVCNPNSYASVDACHLLTCALLLLNTDLHNQHLKKKMTCNEFVNNVTHAHSTLKFSSQDLKDFYLNIKTTPLKWSPCNDILNDKSKIIPQSPLNEEDSGAELGMRDHIYMSGYVTRKCVYESHGKKFAKFKRRWKILYAELQGLELKFYRENPSLATTSSSSSNSNRKEKGGKHYLSDKNNAGIFTFDHLASSFSDISHSTACEDANSVNHLSTPSPAGKSFTSEIYGSHASNNVNLYDSISIHHSLAWPENGITTAAEVFDKTKISEIFRLKTANGAEYLFEVHNKHLCEQWICQINYASALLSPPPLPSPVGSRPDSYRPVYHFSYTNCNPKEQLRRYEEHHNSLSGDLLRIQNQVSSNNSMSKSVQVNCIDHINFIQYEIQRFQSYIDQVKAHLCKSNMKSSSTTLLPSINRFLSQESTTAPSSNAPACVSSIILKGRTTSLSSLPDSRSFMNSSARSSTGRRSILNFVRLKSYSRPTPF